MIRGSRGGCSRTEGEQSEGHGRGGISQAWQLIAFVGEEGRGVKARCLKE